MLFTVALVIVAQEVAGIGSPFNKIHHVSPQFLALFALGVLAVSLVHGDRAGKLRRPLTAAGLVAIGSFVVLAVVEGSVWVVGHYFWIDMLFGVGVACLMAAMFGGGLPRVRGVFASRVAVTLGLFSYSIYLLHGPLVGLVYQEVLYPMHLSPLATFAALLAIGIPFILLVCYALPPRVRGALPACPRQERVPRDADRRSLATQERGRARVRPGFRHAGAVRWPPKRDKPSRPKVIRFPGRYLTVRVHTDMTRHPAIHSRLEPSA